MTPPPANFSAPVAAPVSTCLTIHLSAKHPRPYAPQQVVIALSEYILLFISFSPLTLYTFLSSSQQRHSSGSALPLHLLPGGGANGQQGRQQHPRFLMKIKTCFFSLNFLVSVAAAVTSRERPLLAQRRSLRPPSSLLRALPYPLIGLCIVNNQVGVNKALPQVST